MYYIYKVGVVGAGQMGAGIAQAITYSGIPVVLKDLNQELLDKGVKYIKSVYETRVNKGKMSPDDMNMKLQLVTTTTDYKDFADCDLIIEAVPEKLAVKMEVFNEISKVVPESCLITSNTSSLSISKMATAVKKPENFLGFHFFYPANVMKLVEIISGLQTSQDAIDSIVSFSESIRKLPVKVKECPGFLVNRVLMPYLNEACYLVQDGIKTPEEVDAELIKFGMPMGPFMLVDHLGLDICMEVSEIMVDAYGSKAKAPEIMSKLVDGGRLGKKSGAGFYVYDGSSDEFQNFYKVEKKEKEVDIVKRVLYPMINEASNCIDESISSPSDIDLALLAGIGFPQNTKGLLRWADEQGLDNVFTYIKDLRSEFGDRFVPSLYLRRLVDAGFTGKSVKKGFYEY